MRFSDFQTETATLEKIETDAYGDPSVADSFEVEVDPVFGYKRIHTGEGEEITGRSTIITGMGDGFDPTHRNWRLAFRGKEWQVEEAVPFYPAGSNELDFVELTMR